MTDCVHNTGASPRTDRLVLPILLAGDDHVEWPPLQQGSRGLKNQTNDVCVNGHENHWESLIEVNERCSEVEFVVSHSDEVVGTGGSRLRHHLRHCESSPNLRDQNRAGDEFGTADEEDDDFLDDSYDVVSRQASVLSTWSTSSLSFRDAILANSTPISDVATSIENKKCRGNRSLVNEISPLRTKPTFIVTSIRRCVHSTGDLPSLGRVQENHVFCRKDGDGDGEIYGDTDAAEFYCRKALGAQSRRTGLRIRPDEAKRKALILQKKAVQRNRQRT
jgi:hypothetical protein